MKYERSVNGQRGSVPIPPVPHLLSNRKQNKVISLQSRQDLRSCRLCFRICPYSIQSYEGRKGEEKSLKQVKNNVFSRFYEHCSQILYPYLRVIGYLKTGTETETNTSENLKKGRKKRKTQKRKWSILGGTKGWFSIAPEQSNSN